MNRSGIFLNLYRAAAGNWRILMENKSTSRLSFKKVLSPLAIVLMAMIVIMTFINALLRYTVGKNVLSFEEYSRFCFVWICYIGIVIAYEDKRHICVDIIYSHLKGVSRKVVDAVNHVLVIAVSSVVFYALFPQSRHQSFRRHKHEYGRRRDRTSAHGAVPYRHRAYGYV